MTLSTPSATRSQRHERIARRYESGDPIVVIATDEGVDEKTVRNVARRRGLPLRRPDQSERNARIVYRYERGDPVKEIAADAGVAHPYVRGLAVRAGLPARNGWQRRYPIDERAFDEPTSTGWWLIGLLAADGCVSEAEHRVSLSQRAEDADVLHAFLRYVGAPDRPLTEVRVDPVKPTWSKPGALYLEARIFSKRICAALENHGVTPRKSRTLRLSDEAAVQPGVWLGLFDGDGSAGAKLNHGRPRISFYGTREVIGQCSAFWTSALNLPRAPAVSAHAGGLFHVALYSARASDAAKLMLAACSVSHRRKRRVLQEITALQSSPKVSAGTASPPPRRENHGQHQ